MSLPRRIWTTVTSVVAIVVVGALVVATATVVVTVRRPIPQREGRIAVDVLDAAVDVWRDDRGVPHIYADTTADLFRGQGYVAAQERFFEMDLRRHIASGRLSELVGENPEALQADLVVRTLGWREVAEQELRTLTPESREILRAYADGVNAYVDGRSPGSLSVSYSVLGRQLPLERIEPWTAVDSLAWLKAIAWDLSGNRSDELARGALLGEGLSREQVDQLFPPYPDDHPSIVAGTEPILARVPPALPDSMVGEQAGELVSAAALAGLAALDAAPQVVGSGDAIGSNSWVVSGAYTASGRPLLANDPHLAPSVPSVWTQVGLHCRELSEACPFDVTGFTFAAIPGVLIGHNDRIAWGLTTLYADVTDHYLEQLPDPGHYVVDGRVRPLRLRTETIDIAGADSITITVRSTAHGPLLSDVLDTDAEVGQTMPVPATAPARGPGYALSIAWTGLEPGRTMDAVVAINQAGNWAEFQAAASVFDIPSQNLVYADVDGHIGYQAPGRLPVRGAGDGLVPAPGWDSAYDWTGFVDPRLLPNVQDPPRGFLVTANNAVTRNPDAPYLGADTDRGYRAQRLESRLTALLDEARAAAPGQRLTVQDMSRLQGDDRSPLADILVPYLLDVDGLDDFTDQAVTELRDWDGNDSGDSPGAAYANVVWRHVLALTFHDDLPEPLWPSGDDVSLLVVSELLIDPGSPWWDDTTTPGLVEGRDDVLKRALTQARLDLTRLQSKDPAKWRWDRLHVLRAEQTPLGSASVPSPIRRLVNLSPVGVSGSSDDVNATAWDASTGSYDVTSVPSMRMVVDLGDLDASTWVQLTGTSGHPGERHYGDQLDAWADGRTFAWPASRDAVDASTDQRLRLEPAG